MAGQGSIRANGVYDKVSASLDKEGLSRVEFWGVGVNPTVSLAQRVARLAVESRAEAVLACGGGSVIDAAKAAAAGVYCDDLALALAEKRDILKALPVFVVLTLSGSGSEVNADAALTDEARQCKTALCGPALRPVAALVDPRVQAGLPWRLTAGGVVDAMAHVMERYFAGRGEVSLAVDEALLGSLILSAEALRRDGADYEARAGLAWAATLAQSGAAGAGCGGGEWSAHCLAHAVGALCPTAIHAEIVQVVLPAFIEAVMERGEIFRRWAKRVFKRETPAEGLAALRECLARWGGPSRLREFGLTRESLALVAVKAAAEQEGKRGSGAAGVLGRRWPMQAGEILALLEKAY